MLRLPSSLCIFAAKCDWNVHTFMQHVWSLGVAVMRGAHCALQWIHSKIEIFQPHGLAVSKAYRWVSVHQTHLIVLKIGYSPKGNWSQLMNSRLTSSPYNTKASYVRLLQTKFEHFCFLFSHHVWCVLSQQRDRFKSNVIVCSHNMCRAALHGTECRFLLRC